MQKEREELYQESPHARALIHELEQGIDRGLVPQRLINDREIYDLELRRIFAKAWIYVGHESEIPSPGDYVVRSIGEDPFVLVRDENGHVQVLFNSCRHRGTLICRAEKGNTSHFRCPYHGWTYKNNGELVGIPFRQEAYKNLDTTQWGLYKAPHTAIYEGLVFACLDPDAMPFDQYLGDLKWYFDMNFKLMGGMEVIGGPHRWIIDNTDWKVAAVNFGGDAYHITITHRSAIDAKLAFPNSGFEHSPTTSQVSEVSGHSLSIRLWDSSHTEDYFWGHPKEQIAKFHKQAVSPEQLEIARRSIINVGTMFPNLGFLHAGEHTDSVEKPVGSFFTLRQWQPKGPGKFEMWSWLLAPKGSSEEFKRRTYMIGNSAFSPSGNFEQDDIAVWNGITTTAGSVFAEQVKNKLNYQMGFGWMSTGTPRKDWPGPGVAYSSNLEEGTQRTFWGHWLRLMKR